MAHFEQDRDYKDLDGNLKTFTIRDYSKPKPVFGNKESTEEEKTAIQKEYHDSIIACVEDIVDSNPAIFAREHPTAVHVYDEKIEWNKEGLYVMMRDPDRFIYGSDLSRLKHMLTDNILEHLGYKECPHNFLDVIESFRQKYRETKTI